MSLCPAFRNRLRSLWRQFFGTIASIALMEFVLKNPCQQLCSFSLAPCQRSYSYACPMAQGLEPLASLGQSSPQAISTSWTHSFSGQSCIDGNCPEKPVPPALHFCIAPSQRSPPKLFHASQSIHARPALPARSLQRSSPQRSSPQANYFHASQSIQALPSRSLQRRSPQAISKLFHAISTLSTPSVLVPFFLPSLPPSLPSFLPSLLVRLFCLATLAAK